MSYSSTANLFCSCHHDARNCVAHVASTTLGVAVLWELAARALGGAAALALALGYCGALKLVPGVSWSVAGGATAVIGLGRVARAALWGGAAAAGAPQPLLTTATALGALPHTSVPTYQQLARAANGARPRHAATNWSLPPRQHDAPHHA